jgi:hypothetical protein
MGPSGFLLVLAYFNRTAPGANTNIIANGINNSVNSKTTATSYAPTVDCFIAVSVALTTASVFNMTESDGTTTFTHGLEKSLTLPVGDLYTWSGIPVIRGFTYNFQVETDSVIRRLFICELQNGTAS